MIHVHTDVEEASLYLERKAVSLLVSTTVDCNEGRLLLENGNISSETR